MARSRAQRRQARLLAATDPAVRQRNDLANGYRPLSRSARDLPAMTHDRMIEIACYLWDRNALGRRIIMAQAEWMIGEGVGFRAVEPRVQQLLEEYWSLNRIELGLMPMVCELGLFGEDFTPVIPRKYSGVMYQGILDPGWITEVVPSPDNAAVPILVVQRASTTMPERLWKVVLRREDEESLSDPALAERERGTAGEIMVAQVNKLRLQTRGKSDLFALMDHLDGYEQILFMDMMKRRAMTSYFWDYKFEGMDQDEIDEQVQALGAPQPFGVFAHNEKVERKLVGPDTGVAESQAVELRSFRNHVLGGAGLGEHWYGGGGDVNRSTADAMDAMTTKTLTARQTSLKFLLRDRLLTQVEMGIRAGRIRDTPDARDIEIDMPDLSTLDLSRVSTGFQSIMGGLAMAMRDGIVDRATAGRFVGALGKHLQIDVDVDEMLKNAKEESTANLVDQATRAMDRQLPARPGVAER